MLPLRPARSLENTSETLAGMDVLYMYTGLACKALSTTHLLIVCV